MDLKCQICGRTIATAIKGTMRPDGAVCVPCYDKKATAAEWTAVVVLRALERLAELPAPQMGGGSAPVITALARAYEALRGGSE